MGKKKLIRTRGKLSLSKYFQDLKKGDSVAVIREVSVDCNFPERLQGRTGTVEGKRGRACVVRIKLGGKEKQYLIEPIHLKKIKQIK